MFDQWLMVLEILLLIWIVVQGEYVRYYEREVFRMNKDRFEERKKWRLEKQEQMRRKSTIKTNVSSGNLELPSPIKTKDDDSKTTDANSAI